MNQDIMIDGVSMYSLGWLRETMDFPTPQAQSSTVTVPGRNSPIRFTEALGTVSFEPRSFSITLSMLGTRSAFNSLVSETVNRYEGQLCKVITSEEPDLYALGTLEMEPSYDSSTGKGQLVISCSDADSYRYHVDETEKTFTGSGTLLITNDYMPVVPVVSTTAETTLAWKIGDESFSRTLSAGTWEIPELELQHGDNSITVTGSGTVTLKFREGRL